MAVTVTTSGFTSINTCENAGNWTGETPVDVTDFYKEGTQCVGFTVRGTGDNDIYITGSWDLSTKTHLRCWMMTNALKELNTDANGGIQFYASDGSNTGYWYVSGSTTYPGGWYPLVLDTGRSVTSGTKPTMSAITTIGLRFNHTASAKNSQNTWIDFVCLLDGLIAYGDVSGSPFDYDEIFTAADNPTTGGWPVMQRINDQYFLSGSLTLGDGSSTNSCDFESKGQNLFFEDRPVSSTLYGITITGNSTGSTDIVFGSVVGTGDSRQGVNGGTISSVGSASWSWNSQTNISNITSIQVYGANWSGAEDGIKLDGKSTITNSSFISTAFINCGEIESGGTSGGVEMLSCSIVDPTGTSNNYGLKFTQTPVTGTLSHNIKKINFITSGTPTTQYMVHFPYSGDYSIIFEDMLFFGTYGGTIYQFLNTGTSADVIVSGTGTTNADDTYVSNTAGGTVDVQISYTISIKVQDRNTDPIESALTAIYKISDRTEITRDTTSALGIVSDTYSGTIPVDVEIRCRKASSGSTKYKNFSTLGQINGNFSLLITMIEDPTNNATS